MFVLQIGHVHKHLNIGNIAVSQVLISQTEPIENEKSEGLILSRIINRYRNGSF
jgi:hypothetical protein